MDSTIIAAILTVLGTLGGTWIGNRLSRKSSIAAIEASNENALKIMKRQEFNVSAARFHNSFTGTILALRQNIDGRKTKNILDIITNKTLTRQEKSKIIFESSLASSEIEGFNAEWEKYRDCRYAYESNPENLNPQTKEESQYCLNHIINLLKFTSKT